MATSSPSPRPFSPLIPLIASSPSPSHNTSPTPPPRPPSSPGISVFAPRPMRIPMYRPQFSRPVFLYDSETTDREKENAQAGPSISTTRRSSVASTGIPEEGGFDSKIIFSPSKDVLDELFKIVRPTSASSASTASTAPPNTSSPSTIFARPQPLHPRSPNAGHRRNTSDASDGGLSSILGGLTVLTGNPRTSPDGGEWRNMRPAVSPVARRALGNPMVRDPSFHGESKKET
ncbi:hypothetical protein ABW20_dc0106741 [Dactylellina cionopaga]|nr:hypothetical protein ABW20_dc0106741 [Dactylellina cionopaga]